MKTGAIITMAILSSLMGWNQHILIDFKSNLQALFKLHSDFSQIDVLQNDLQWMLDNMTPDKPDIS